MNVHRILMPTPVSRLADLRTLARELCMSLAQVRQWLADLDVPIIPVGSIESYYMPALDVRLYERGMGRPFSLSDWREIADVYAGLRRSNLLSVLRTMGDAFVGELSREDKRRQVSRRSVRRKRPIAPGVLRLQHSGRLSGGNGVEPPGGIADHRQSGQECEQGGRTPGSNGLPAEAHEGSSQTERADPERAGSPLEGPG